MATAERPSTPAASPGEATGWLLIVMAATTWGTMGTAGKLLGSEAGASAVMIGFVRLLIAAPLLLGIATVIEGPIRIRRPGFILGGTCMAAYQICFFSGVPLAGVAVTTLLTICTAPLMIALLSFLFLKERLTQRVLGALTVGVVGTTLLVGGAEIHAGPHFLLGVLLALGAALGYAVFAVMTKVGLGDFKPLSLSALTLSVAGLVLLPIVLITHPSVSEVARGWPLFLYMGLAPTAFSYGLYTIGLRRTTATKASIAGLVEPLTATMLGVIVFREQLGALGWTGAALLLSALLFLSYPTRRNNDEPVPIPEVMPDSHAGE